MLQLHNCLIKAMGKCTLWLCDHEVRISGDMRQFADDFFTIQSGHRKVLLKPLARPRRKPNKRMH